MKTPSKTPAPHTPIPHNPTPEKSPAPATPESSITPENPTSELPLLQSPLWQNFQTSLGATTFYQSTPDYAYLAIKKSTPLGPYLYLPYGPYLPTKNAAKPALEALEALAHEQNAIFLRFEPQAPERASYLLSQPNCHKSRDLNPAHTWRLDLTPDLDQLYSDMRQNTRNLCKNYPKKGLTVTTSKDPADIRHLVRLQRELAATKHISTYSEEYLKTELQQPFATLYLVHLSPQENPTPENPSEPPTLTPENSPENPAPTSEIIGASLFFDFAGTRFYMQSATSLRHKKLPISYALLIEAIKDAKSQGLTTFDFWGIAPENAPATHPWAGFTAFKKSFGGYPVTYAGTHDLILSPVKYRTYTALRHLNRLRPR